MKNKILRVGKYLNYMERKKKLGKINQFIYYKKYRINYNRR